MKRCTKCQSKGPFYKRSRSRDGLDCWCKVCRNRSNDRRKAEKRREKRKRDPRPTFEEIGLLLCEWEEARSRGWIDGAEHLARLGKLFRETKCVQSPDVRPI